MSKYLLPTQKGQTSFPQTMRVPCAVDVRNVGDPELRELALSILAPDIHKFFIQSEHTASLSAVSLTVLRRSAPGASMKYLSHHGIARISVEMTPEGIENLNRIRGTAPAVWLLRFLDSSASPYYVSEMTEVSFYPSNPDQKYARRVLNREWNSTDAPSWYAGFVYRAPRYEGVLIDMRRWLLEQGLSRMDIRLDFVWRSIPGLLATFSTIQTAPAAFEAVTFPTAEFSDLLDANNAAVTSLERVAVQQQIVDRIHANEGEGIFVGAREFPMQPYTNSSIASTPPLYRTVTVSSKHLAIDMTVDDRGKAFTVNRTGWRYDTTSSPITWLT